MTKQQFQNHVIQKNMTSATGRKISADTNCYHEGADLTQ